ncbi:glutamate dehydrogenase (NADP) [Kytococcus aerolatus]|uniref:Glutamate dehydrogenase n=2 Tax=Kytococcus aerolatus TaxID=592308 RepID=A0A212U5H9_9MICO|nr:glutamate dehydrogenase (NADP) [Kytococcus aerolatus]
MFELMDEWGPEKVVTVNHQRSGMQGVLVIDNTARGPGKGGTRMRADLTVQEVARLARVMTWKWAAVDLYQGGAKAGIRFDPASPRKEEALRAFARMLRNEVPSEYVFGLDMGLAEQDAAILCDELGDRGAATGTPAALGGVAYDALGVTGHGVAEAVDAATTHCELDDRRVVIQGFGAVGHATARRLDELGYRVVAVSTAAGAVHAPDGLDVAELLALREEHGDALVDHASGTRLEAGQELMLETGVLVPAAQQGVLHAGNADDVRARLVVEGANLPTDEAARQQLAARGVTVVPDFIANAGGIIAAAFGMRDRYSPFGVEVEQIIPTVTERMRANTRTVLETAERSDTLPHAAAGALARERVREAMRLRGQLPPT